MAKTIVEEIEATEEYEEKLRKRITELEREVNNSQEIAKALDAVCSEHLAAIERLGERCEECADELKNLRNLCVSPFGFSFSGIRKKLHDIEDKLRGGSQ